MFTKIQEQGEIILNIIHQIGLGKDSSIIKEVKIITSVQFLFFNNDV